MTYELLGIPGSPFVRKVAITLGEKHLPHRHVLTSLFPLPAGFEALNPLKTLPVLRLADGTHLADSTAIGLFLDRRHPEHPLYPADDVAYAQALLWEEYADTVVARTIGLGVFRPLVVGPLMGKTPDFERIRRTLEQRLPPVLDRLTQQLADREYVVGTRFTIADIAVFTQLVNLSLAGFELDADRYPTLAGWYRSIGERSVVQALVEKERTLVPPAAPWPDGSKPT